MKKTILIILICLLVIAGALLVYDRLVPQGLMGAGVTNLTNLELAGTLDVVGNTDLTGTLVYGANNLYPVGFASSGQELLYVIQDVTANEIIVSTGLSTITFAVCSMCEVPEVATDAAFCTIDVTTNVVRAKIWQADGSTSSNEADVCIMTLIVGAP